MPALVVVGAQWGDEGKGKIVDLLAEKAGVVARYQGGANAGHEVVVGGKSFVLHLVPAGILHADKLCVIGNGVVVDALALAREIEDLRSRGVKVDGNLKISTLAHLTFSFHRSLDASRESHGKSNKIGTTQRGIGPTYMDKVGRVGLRAGDLLSPARLRQALAQNLMEKNLLLKSVYRSKPLSPALALKEAASFLSILKPFLADTVELLETAWQKGRNILLEGAQGTLLDVDFGTYPYVSASNGSAGGACTGSGLGPTRVGRVLGVCKAYTTRVGEGPFPTELPPTQNQALRERGDEFGRTTGRARRCGWLDAVALRHAAMVNGMTELAITKLDVLDDLKEILVADSYRVKGRAIRRFPANLEEMESARPNYLKLPGWRASTRKARSLAQLPANARRYLTAIERLSGVPVSIVSVGPARDQTIFLNTKSRDYRF